MIEKNNNFGRKFLNSTIADVIVGIKQLKRGKACGYSVLFLMLECLPDEILDATIIALIKTKKGDFTDKEKYLPLAISCIVSKLFEFVILNRYNTLLKSRANQFGFKP